MKDNLIHKSRNYLVGHVSLVILDGSNWDSVYTKPRPLPELIWNTDQERRTYASKPVVKASVCLLSSCKACATCQGLYFHSIFCKPINMYYEVSNPNFPKSTHLSSPPRHICRCVSHHPRLANVPKFLSTAVHHVSQHSVKQKQRTEKTGTCGRSNERAGYSHSTLAFHIHPASGSNKP